MKAEGCLCLNFFLTAAWIIWLKVMALHVFIKTLFSAKDPNNHDIWQVYTAFPMYRNQSLVGLV